MDRYSRWHDADEAGTISQPAASRCTCEHDGTKRVLRITGRDGRTTEFLDRAVRSLVVVPDPTTGRLEPLLNGARPKVIDLCREAEERNRDELVMPSGPKTSCVLVSVRFPVLASPLDHLQLRSTLSKPFT